MSPEIFSHNDALTTTTARTDRGEPKKKEPLFFLPSQETAWFLGALSSNKGSVFPARNRFQLICKSPDDPVLHAFMDIGSRLLSGTEEEKQGYVSEEESGSVAAYFYSAAATRELGDFSRKNKADTISRRFLWVFLDQYIKSFASGVFDSGANISNQRVNSIDFNTKYEGTADLINAMLTRLGVRYARRSFRPDANLFSIKIQRIADLRTFAGQITSLDPDKQQILEAWKDLSPRKKTTEVPESAEELYAEYQRLCALEGGHPSAARIHHLRNEGQTKFPLSVLVKYLGNDEKTNSSSFRKLGERMQELTEMDPLARSETLSGIVIYNGNQKYDRDLILAEGRRIYTKYGRFTTTLIEELVASGECPYSVSIFARYLGKTKDGRRSFPLVREIISRENAAQIYP